MTFNPFTGNFDFTGMSQVDADARYARLASANIFSANGAANASALKFTGSIFTGDGTTATPQVLHTDGSFTVTNWDPAGTILGFAHTGFGGRYLQANNGPSGTLWFIDANSFGVRDTGSNFHTRLGFNGVTTNSNGAFYWTTGNGTDPTATALFTDGAGILAIRNGTNAQTQRIYGTFTDASNYERLSFITTAGAYSIKPEAAGTGSLRTLQISGLPTSNPGPGILWNNLGIPAIGT